MVVFTELARRGLSHPKTVSFVKRAVAGAHGPDATLEVPAWGQALLFVSFVVGIVAMILVSYMLKEVVVTLCMVETPSAAITISPSTHESGDKAEKENLLETGPTITLTPQKPITASIRGTVKHLRENAGRFSQFRGFRINMVYSFVFGLVALPIKGIIPPVPGSMILVLALAAMIAAPIHAAWTHKVISMPSDKTFLQRIPAKQHWKTLALPAAINAVMPQLSMSLIAIVAVLMGLNDLEPEEIEKYSGAQLTSLVARFFSLVLLGITCTLFLCLPAHVTLARVEASILPEDEDTIVPFDRTFGGKAVSKILGGTGVVGFLDAWRSFGWEARRRLIKLYVKVFATITGVAMIFVHVLLAEAFIVMGSKLPELLARLDANLEAGAPPMM